MPHDEDSPRTERGRATAPAPNGPPAGDRAARGPRPTTTGQRTKPAASRYDATPYVPQHADLALLRETAADCRGCPLFQDATQTVFSSGDVSARMMLIGEEPGDQEDRRGEPFVGPAGGVLTRALAEAAIDPAETYLTNAVKHFKFERSGRGKRRIHKPPTLRELTACKPWLAAEVRLVQPAVVVALGAHAGKTLFGSDFRVTRQRGMVLPMPPLDGGAPPGGALVATIHPSAVLRADREDRAEVYDGLVADLTVAARLLHH